MDWKDVQPVQQNLFLMPALNSGPIDFEIDWFRPIEDPAERKEVFVCGACKSSVDKYTHFEGWECVGIDPECGDETEIWDSGQDRIYRVEYVCSNGCGWSARQLWFDLINNADEQKDKIIALDIETKAQGEAPKETGTIRVDWSGAPNLLELDRIYRNLPGSNSWGELWPTSWTS
jgi:predicted RNA-binding Zn-ribbon protein involved in translation (DUF1610 family)